MKIEGWHEGIERADHPVSGSTTSGVLKRARCGVIVLPPGSASLGELVAQGKNNLQAPWLAGTGFVVLGGVLTLLVFVGEAVRDAFDPRKLPGGSKA